MRSQWPEDSPWFKVWFVFCILVALVVVGVGIWAVISVVQFVTH